MAKIKKILIFAADITIFYASLVFTVFLRYGREEFALRFSDHLIPFSVLFVVWFLVMYLFDLYKNHISKAFNLTKTITYAVSVSALVSIVLFYFFPEFFKLTPKTNLIIFSIFFLALKYLIHKMLIFKIFASAAEKIIIVGNSPTISETYLYLRDNPQAGYKIEAWFDSPKDIETKKIIQKIKESNAKTVIFQNRLTKERDISKIIYTLISQEVDIINFWDFYETVFDHIPIDETEEMWFIKNVSSRRPFYDFFKRVAEIVVSFIALIIFLPLIAIIAILIKLTSSGPAIFKQERVGKHGNKFILYKFRTMHQSSKGPLWTEGKDKRLTATGKILRISHLDELPQLWNIFTGDISLTGPRPERKELVEKYKNLPYYEMRHIIKPGLTGWAQVNYKPSASVEEAKKKLCYDIFYIKNRSLFLDLVIMVRTIRYFFTSNR